MNAALVPSVRKKFSWSLYATYRGQRREADVPVALERQVQVLLLVLRLDVVDVAEQVLVRVLVERRRAEERRRVRERDRGVEIDRAGIDLGDTWP